MVHGAVGTDHRKIKINARGLKARRCFGSWHTIPHKAAHLHRTTFFELKSLDAERSAILFQRIADTDCQRPFLYADSQFSPGKFQLEFSCVCSCEDSHRLYFPYSRICRLRLAVNFQAYSAFSFLSGFHRQRNPARSVVYLLPAWKIHRNLLDDQTTLRFGGRLCHRLRFRGFCR